MIGLSKLALAIGALLLGAPTSIFAQARRYPSMTEALAARTPEGWRGVRPDSAKEVWADGVKGCIPTHTPDSLFLVAGEAHMHTLDLWAWEKVANGPILWRPWNPPSAVWNQPDTLRAALVSIICHPSGGADFLLEHDGHFFGVSESSLLRAFNGQLDAWDSTAQVRIKGAWGRLEPAVEVLSLGKLEPITLIGLSGFRHDLTVREGADSARRVAAIRARRWPADMTRAAIRHQVAIGMTAEMVRMSWGEPNSINRTVTGRFTNEQWVYSTNSYVYLRDGVVTAIQTRR